MYTKITKDFSAWPGEQFFAVEVRGATTVIVINTRHRFYSEIYEPLLKESNVTAVRAIDALLMAFAEAEAELHGDSDKLEEIHSRWGHYINMCLSPTKKVA